MSDIYSIFLSIWYGLSVCHLQYFYHRPLRGLPFFELCDNLDIMAQNGIDNLIPLASRTSEERRAIAIRAGQASGVVRRKNREITEIFGRYLARHHDIRILEDGKYVDKKLSTSEFFNYVLDQVIGKCDKSSVMMILGMQKAREGSTIHIDSGAVDQDLEAASAEVLKAEFEAELAKRDKILSARKVEALPDDAAPGQVVAYEVESTEGVPAASGMAQAAQPAAQGEALEPTRQEVVKDDDATQP